jgi:hypothetical protein
MQEIDYERQNQPPVKRVPRVEKVESMLDKAKEQMDEEIDEVKQMN